MSQKRFDLTKMLVAGLLAFAGVALGSSSSQSQPAPGQSGFWCGTSSGAPTTLYQNRQGGTEPWIVWSSNAMAGAGYDNLTRCQQVSARLETYRVQRKLKYVTVGRMNGQNVICTASQVNGRCEGLIYTLKPAQDPIKTLYNFMAWREGQAGTPSLYESGEIPYINVEERLREDASPVTPVTPEAPAPSNPSPAPEPSNQGELREL